MRLLKTAMVLGVLVVMPPLTQAAEPAMVAGCTGFRFNLDHELKLFSAEPEKIEAASGPEAKMLEPDTLYVASLDNQSAVRFVVAPDKVTVAEGSYAGLFQVSTGRAGRMRVTLDEAAWIDVIDKGRALTSIQHTGSHDCKLLRKSVEFAVEPGSKPVIQISGSTDKEIRLAISLPAAGAGAK